jgi:hypothetical protein
VAKARLLNEVITTLKGVKTRTNARCTELHRTLQKPELITGLVREYKSKFDGGDQHPPESKKVQAIAVEQLDEMAKLTAELFDAEAALDFANCTARADVIVGERVILADAPSTFLLFVEKQLIDLHTTLTQMIVLDEADNWNEDANQRGLYRTAPVDTARTKKVIRPLILAPATDKHPAQTDKITEDIIEGYWTVTKLSGAVPSKAKKALLDRIDRLVDAVREARERANLVAAPHIPAGRNFMDYVFGR